MLSSNKCFSRPNSEVSRAANFIIFSDELRTTSLVNGCSSSSIVQHHWLSVQELTHKAKSRRSSKSTHLLNYAALQTWVEQMPNTSRRAECRLKLRLSRRAKLPGHSEAPMTAPISAIGSWHKQRDVVDTKSRKFV